MKIKIIASLLLSTILGTSLVMAGSHESKDPPPDATISFSEWEYGLILNGNNGHGVLSYGEHEYVFHMAGAKVGGLGVTHSESTGDVYNLKSVDDLVGKYFTAEAGATGVVGGSGTWIKNSKGVSIHIKSKSKGLALSIGVGGLRIYFKHDDQLANDG
jgi:hypothetical protein